MANKTAPSPTSAEVKHFNQRLDNTKQKTSFPALAAHNQIEPPGNDAATIAANGTRALRDAIQLSLTPSAKPNGVESAKFVQEQGLETYLKRAPNVGARQQDVADLTRATAAPSYPVWKLLVASGTNKDAAYQYQQLIDQAAAASSG